MNCDVVFFLLSFSRLMHSRIVISRIHMRSTRKKKEVKHIDVILLLHVIGPSEFNFEIEIKLSGEVCAAFVSIIHICCRDTRYKMGAAAPGTYDERTSTQSFDMQLMQLQSKWLIQWNLSAVATRVDCCHSPSGHSIIANDTNNVE